MQIPLTSMEQLLPFPTAQELIAKKHEPPVSVPPDATVQAALQLMADKHVGFLAVIDGGRLAGVLSERDCARRVILKQLPAASTAVRDLMGTLIEWHERLLRRLGEERLTLMYPDPSSY